MKKIEELQNANKGKNKFQGKDSNRLVKFYTGFPSQEVFMWIYEVIITVQKFQ